jgi:hypothetical protein
MQEGLLMRNYSRSIVFLNPTGGWPTPSDGQTLHIVLADMCVDLQCAHSAKSDATP